MHGAAAAQTQLGQIVMVAQGTMRASVPDERGVLAFKGIPYAAAPVGPLRWRAPQPTPASSADIDATRFGARCLSAWTNDPAPGPPRSEDCLKLNVWTAAGRTAEKRPVMVWIHGGGFQFGSSAEPSSDGSRLAEKGVVVVSINYRVGVFGFMAHPDLDREGPSGNYGLQDQIAALRWVKLNVAAFGGDPANVTVFGESAGAHAIGLLLASPLAKGLIHKAIGQSGAFWDSEHGSLATRDEARRRGVALAATLRARSLTDLREVPADRLNAAADWDFTKDPGTTAFSPSIDGYVVPQAPASRYAAGKQLRVPLMAGWNSAEDLPFRARALPHSSASVFREAAAEQFGRDRLADFFAHYPAASDQQAKSSANALVGDLVISQQVWEWLSLHKASGRAPVYGYRFSYTSPYVPVASHAVDPPFVFGTLTPQRIVGSTTPPGEADRALSDQMMSYWVNFATHGDPNGPGLPRWPVFGTNSEVLEIGSALAIKIPAEAARLRFLSSYRRYGALPTRWRTLPKAGPALSTQSRSSSYP
ncbi:carboxylesterase/lipase family protein [uncultured Sphingomonas sp.]|uniref:carboxylesterase/lipase family protein n=1 Tax=uncultured Sphingomonas sp. TaxID=158754 RepID=UPI0035C9FDD3